MFIYNLLYETIWPPMALFNELRPSYTYFVIYTYFDVRRAGLPLDITPNLFPTTDHSLPAKTSFLKTTTTMAAATSVILSPKIDSSQKQVQLVAFAYYLVRVILYYCCILYTRYYVVLLCTSENSLRQTCCKEVRILPTLFEKHLQHLLAPAAFFRVMVSALPR